MESDGRNFLKKTEYISVWYICTVEATPQNFRKRSTSGVEKKTHSTEISQFSRRRNQVETNISARVRLKTQHK